MASTISRGYSTRCPLTWSAIAGGCSAKHASHRPVEPVGRNRRQLWHQVALTERAPEKIAAVDDHAVTDARPVRQCQLLDRVPVQLEFSMNATVPVGPPAPPPAYTSTSPR